MKIMVIGSGGREHTLAWKLAQSKRVTQVVVVPGNGGMASADGKIICLAPPAAGVAGLVEVALKENFALTVVGPEVPLAEGIVDRFQAQGLRIWGPSQAAAQIEASKVFAKDFMKRQQIPTSDYAVFSNFLAAQQYLYKQLAPVVIKADGLAAGKGVMLPASMLEASEALRQIMVEHRFGAAGEQVIIEERLAGPEISLLAFCDGKTAKLILPAQDHKRAFDGDVGPNTGGMGAFAPAEICSPAEINQIVETILQPTLDGLRAEGRDFVGVLYIGLMLTADGPRVLEYNCRFGDPETQVTLPLLETDLVEIFEHSINGTLADLDITWQTGAAATVVLASGGYPDKYEKGKPITGLDQANALEGVTVFHAGTKLTTAGQIMTDGGRVLNVTGVGADLPQALARAYQAVKLIQFDKMYYRTDIAAKYIKK